MRMFAVSLLIVPALVAPAFALAGHDLSDTHVQVVQKAMDAKIKAKKELAKAQTEAVQKGQPIPAAPTETVAKAPRPAGAHP